MPKRKERKLPQSGSRFSKTFKGETYTMEVVKEAGVVRYKVGREVYASLSAAAKSITKTDVNGWVFWGLEKPVDRAAK
ncbi:DUF2924 domain-containing protein [Chloroflexota bacterium]